MLIEKTEGKDKKTEDLAILEEPPILDKKYDSLVLLIGVYLDEWMHRDTLLWQQVFKHFYATLIITLLPNASIGQFQLQLPDLSSFVFRIVGLLMSFFFLYVSIGYSKRLEATSNTIRDLIAKLPSEFQRMKLDDSKIFLGKYFKPRLTEIICIFMFLSLVLINAFYIFS
jgi:hypothetical protein